jgi:hypothetical protein
MENAGDYYKRHGQMTAAASFRSELRALPNSVAELCRVIQGDLIHRDLAAWLYELKLTEKQMDAANLRSFTEVLGKVRALDDRPLTAAREPSHRMPCVCRHFSTMLCAILREQEVPARARCGFGAYFNPGKFEDHWLCEYWNANQSRWILVDAQLDGHSARLLTSTSIRSTCLATGSSSQATRGRCVVADAPIQIGSGYH